MVRETPPIPDRLVGTCIPWGHRPGVRLSPGSGTGTRRLGSPSLPCAAGRRPATLQNPHDSAGSARFLQQRCHSASVLNPRTHSDPAAEKGLGGTDKRAVTGRVACATHAAKKRPGTPALAAEGPPGARTRVPSYGTRRGVWGAFPRVGVPGGVARAGSGALKARAQYLQQAARSPKPVPPPVRAAAAPDSAAGPLPT